MIGDQVQKYNETALDTSQKEGTKSDFLVKTPAVPTRMIVPRELSMHIRPMYHP